MALEIEGVVDGGVHGEKPLGGASRLEPLRRLRIFGQRDKLEANRSKRGVRWA
jgi:hypothetical protein